MSILLIAEHNNSNLKVFTLNTITAASKIDNEVHVLVAGSKCDNVAKEVAQGGKGAIEDAITNIQFGRENNVDTAGGAPVFVSAIDTMPGSVQS